MIGFRTAILKLARVVSAIVVFSLFVGLTLESPAQAEPPQGWKAKELSQVDEKKWIEAVKQRKAADGATVWQVLQYAEKMRPKKFKVGAIEVGYNGRSGDADGVGVGYWIGMKRLEGDSFTDLWYDIEIKESKARAIPRENNYTSETITNAIEFGRDKFLIYIDDMYAQTCMDTETKHKLC